MNACLRSTTSPFKVGGDQLDPVGVMLAYLNRQPSDRLSFMSMVTE